MSQTVRLCLAVLALSLSPAIAAAQMGGMGGGGMGGMGGMGGGPPGGGGAPPGLEKPKFREHIHRQGGLPLHRKKGDALVAGTRIVGNRAISTHRIAQQLQTRKGRFFDQETVFGDIRRLNDMGTFENVTFDIEEREDGYFVTFYVEERPVISRVVYHGNQALNDRELAGRAGLSESDPLSEFSVDWARRRLLDYYQEEGFNRVSIQSKIGLEGDPGAVVFRINEGPLERIADLRVEGATIVSEARLKKIIKSRGPFGGVYPYFNNEADLAKIDRDVEILESYYHDLGFLTATAGRRLEYDETGKWLTVTFVINEGERFRVNNIQIEGNQFITKESIRRRLELKSGDMFNGTVMRRDVGEITYGYGELGFIYAEVEPQTIMRDDESAVDLVYKITEGDRWKIGKILVNIDGEPHLMRETTMLNLIEQREGDWIDRRKLELDRVRLERSQLLETNPQVAEPPDIKVVPVNDPLQ